MPVGQCQHNLIVDEFVDQSIFSIVSANLQSRKVQADGRKVARQSGFVVEDFSTPSTDFAERLGAIPSEENDWGMLELAGASGTTNIPGLYVVGDARIGFSGIVAAVSEGGFCVEMIAHEVTMERWNALSVGLV
ncbi:hypothetical protein MXMO3_03540 (plasmid) [Maritalea myrionectae]|uniref:Thioredoxin-disulfide reductase n=1 Tax=Maritalea myrionectae TaxID=454601 RepID=A0A2R4MJ77_9HYPH|nr:hypothetical protein [Maritalea myrionectae]AVX06043.1 hypothetical protein MXMO3_03540 [Maritalea myrionectae]